MAAAAVPLILGLAPSLINLIVGLIHRHAPVAQANMGPGTGAVKFAQVFQAVMTDLQNAAAAGQIDKALPADQVVQAIIQSVVQSLKLSGQLASSQPAAPSSDNASNTAPTLPPVPGLVLTGTFTLQPK